MLDIRPMAWQATVIAPAEDADVTVVVRVTYYTIEQLCAGELFDEPAAAVLN